MLFSLSLSLMVPGCTRCGDAPRAKFDAGARQTRRSIDLRTALIQAYPEYRETAVLEARVSVTRVIPELTAPLRDEALLKLKYAPADAGVGWNLNKFHLEQLAHDTLVVSRSLSADDLGHAYLAPSGLSSMEMALYLPRQLSVGQETFELNLHYASSPARCRALVRQAVSLLEATQQWRVTKAPPPGAGRRRRRARRIRGGAHPSRRRSAHLPAARGQVGEVSLETKARPLSKIPIDRDGHSLFPSSPVDSPPALSKRLVQQRDWTRAVLTFACRRRFWRDGGWRSRLDGVLLPAGPPASSAGHRCLTIRATSIESSPAMACVSRTSRRPKEDFKDTKFLENWRGASRWPQSAPPLLFVLCSPARRRRSTSWPPCHRRGDLPPALDLELKQLPRHPRAKVAGNCPLGSPGAQRGMRPLLYGGGVDQAFLSPRT